MILTIWRHGQAEIGSVDRLRELTATGRDDIGFACRQFHEACGERDIAHPDLVLYSPWVRTAQTAEIIAAAFTHARSLSEAAIQPGSDPAHVDKALTPIVNVVTPPAHLLLVSHQPLVSQLADHYLGERAIAPPLVPGGLVSMTLDMVGHGCGTLRCWAMPPEYQFGL